jgi:hypothetical protein
LVDVKPRITNIVYIDPARFFRNETLLVLQAKIHLGKGLAPPIYWRCVTILSASKSGQCSNFGTSQYNCREVTIWLIIWASKEIR